MSLESKLEFTEMVRTGLEEILTVRQLNNVMDVLQDVLSAVEVEILYREENGSLTSDDLLSAYLQAKRTEGLSEKTIDHYKRTIGTVSVVYQYRHWERDAYTYPSLLCSRA